MGMPDLKTLRKIAISFTLYSRIPMPRFEWKEDDMSTSLDFFPLVGAMIGVLICVLNTGALLTFIDPYVRSVLTVLVPVFITGGFHLDGFMDTSDALNSYGDTAKKLEILKDPHIGAFSVISLVKLLLTALASSVLLITSENATFRTVVACACIFVISRCISGLTSLYFKKAKKTGMLTGEAGNKRKSTVVLLILQLVVASAAMTVSDPFIAVPVLAFFALCTAYYKKKTVKEFGGVTGDTAGYLVCISETGAALIASVVLLIMRIL